MDIRIAGLVAAAVLAAGTAQAATVEFKDAVARVTVIPENRSDIKVEIVRPNARLPLRISASGDRTIVDGGLQRRLRDCNGRGERARVKVRDVGTVEWNEMPEIVVRTPRDVKVDSGGAVYGSIGRSGSVALRASGCGGWTVADVGGEARIRASGAGSVRMGSAQRLDVRLSGAGGVRAAQVRQGMAAEISGAGGIDIERFAGPLDAKVSGVGRVKVAGGRASAVRASVSGVGGVDFEGVADSLDASISGLGSINVREVTGPVRKSVSGMGKVRVGD